MGTGGVSARDFLEAQTAYTDALSAVASRRIEYIVDRTQLFLNLELMTVNELGFWEPLYDDSFQPETYFEIPIYGDSVFGSLPCVWYSKDIRRMLCVPSGPATIYRAADSQQPETAETEPITPSELQASPDSVLPDSVLPDSASPDTELEREGELPPPENQPSQGLLDDDKKPNKSKFAKG